MARKAGVSDDQRQLEISQRIAALHSWLQNHPGEHESSEIAKDLGVDGRTIGVTLKRMADTDVIPKPRIDGNKKWWRGEGQPAGSEGNGEKKTRQRRNPSTSKDVELVVGGTMIVIGRNPSTNRLRITLEDVGA